VNNRQLSEYYYGKDAPFRCPDCQAVWPEGANFCGYCGVKLVKNIVAKEPTDTADTESVPLI